MFACPRCGAALDVVASAPDAPQVCEQCGERLPAVNESPTGIATGSDQAPDTEDELEATIAVGEGAPTPVAMEDSDDFDFDDDTIEELEGEPTGEPSTSLDATIDLCQWAENRDFEEGGFDLADGEAADLADAVRDSPEAAPQDDATMVFDASRQPSDSADPDSHDSRIDATLPADSDQPSSSMADSAPSSAGVTNEPTLAFDSERHTSGVDTPTPLDLTGLESDATMPHGPLGGGRVSGSLRPGDSQLIGQELVRLRAFQLADPEGQDPRDIDYAIQGEAGKGGMGIVYKATQQSLKRPVALKQIKLDQGAKQSDLDKFVSEAVITGQLEHPNIAPVHDLGLAEDGLPFYAMKFVEGEDWEDSIKEKSEEENLGILIQVAQAIAFAHSKGVLHRDLKPGNVRLGSFGEVLVMDWGLAARLDGSEIQPAGTPIYMPPETALEYLDHARGKVIGGKRMDTSRRRVPAGTYCDVYLLGALLFKIVTGRAPHRGKSTFECLRNAARNEIVKTRRRSELLDIAYKAMATEPESRHATAIEFVDAIKAYQSHAQSIQIAKRASKDLREAGRLLEGKRGDSTELYALFSSAQNGYQNALELWGGNRKAARRLKKAKRMFAESAYAGGDFELALSLLDEGVDDAEDLRASVSTAQTSRRTRLAWFRRLQYATAVSLMLALAFIGYSVVAKLDALSANAEKAKAIADASAARSEAAALVEAAETTAAERINAADRKANQKVKLADLQAAEAVEKANAEAAARVATANRQAEQRIAAADRRVALAGQQADRAAREARAQAYFASLGRVRATLLDRGAYAAWKEMQKVDPEVVAAADDPAWRALARLVDWRSEAAELVGEQPGGEMRPTRLARSGDGRRVIAAAADGPEQTTLTFYRSDRPNQPEKTVRVGVSVGQLAADATGRYLAFAGPELAVFDSQTSKLVPTPATGSPCTRVAFHPTRPELLVGRADTSVERWRISETGTTLLDRDDRWHRAPIQAVAFSPDGTQRVSADESGRIVAWRLAGGSWSERVSFLRGGGGASRVTAVSVSNDRSGRVAVGYDDGSIYELFGWFGERPDPKPNGDYARVASERLASRHAGAVAAIAYAEGGQTILSAGADTLLVQGAPAIGLAPEARRVERRYHDTTVLSCLPAGAGRAFSADARGRVVVWRLDAEADQVVYQTRDGKQREAGVAALRLESNRGRHALVVADRLGFTRRWEDPRQPSQAELRFVGHADHRGFRAWRLGGADPRIVTVAADNRAVVWRESDGLPERTIELGERTVIAVDTRRGRLLAASDGREIPGGPQAIAVSLRDGSRQPLWDDRARVARIAPLREAGPGSPTVAVGLRDGQVYLWGPETGRVELAPSSGRAHWRPIVALSHDPQGNRLLSADRGGLVAAWDLLDGERTETRLPGTDPITRVFAWSDQRTLVVRSGGDGAVATAYDRRLNPIDIPALATPRLVDVASDEQGGLIGIARHDGQTRLLSWSPAGWSTDAEASWRATGMTATAEGRLLWGAGAAQWWGGKGPRTIASPRIVSRVPTVSVVDSVGGTLLLSRAGTIDPWSELSGPSRLPLGGRLVASSEGSSADQAVLAIADPSGKTRLETWDLTTGQKLHSLTEPVTERVLAIASLDRGSVAALESELVFLALDRPRQSVRLPVGTAPPRSIVANRAGNAVTLVTTGGELLLAKRDRAGRWQIHPTDRKQVDSATFTSVGDRLLVGTAGGRVEMLAVAGLERGVYATRRLLSFPGHGDRITHLRVERGGKGRGTTLLSGDASGVVLARPL